MHVMTTTETLPALDIDSHYPLAAAQIEFYRENGYIKLKKVLSPEVLAHYGPEITRLVLDSSGKYAPLEERGTYGKAFLQIMNIWERSELMREFVFGKRLARIAAELMEAPGARMYHDQALYKEPGGGITPWHADQYYWPVSSNKTVTAWIPLTALPREMGPLQISPGTQNMKFGRDLEIGDESEKKLGDVLKDNPLVDTPFDLGEVSFHSGWTFHRAGANTSSKPREVMTIIYMDEDMRLTEPKNKNQQADWDGWCPGAKIGEIINSPKNPLLWSSRWPLPHR